MGNKRISMDRLMAIEDTAEDTGWVQPEDWKFPVTDEEFDYANFLNSEFDYFTEQARLVVSS